MPIGNTPQQLLDAGYTPKEIYDQGYPLSLIYGCNYQGGILFYLDPNTDYALVTINSQIWRLNSGEIVTGNYYYQNAEHSFNFGCSAL